MSKKMLVNATHPEENRVAIVEDGILTELDIEVAGHEPTKGNIYKAVVVRVESGLQAAFVDYGAERMGFLQIDEINYSTVKPDLKLEDGRRPRINELLHRGQEILVQITKEERGTKGAALTTYISLAGRYMVLMPGNQTRGVSRKAESDSQRKQLKKAMSSLEMADDIGYIVRTAALDQTREELERDYRYLIRLFENIKDLEQKAKSPALIYKESNLMIRSIRDYFTTDMDEVLIDDPQVFREAKDFFKMVMPDQTALVKQHQERRPIFSRYQIEDQIETLSKNKVALPSGGSIVIDPTEALVAIDVNSGKMSSEQGVEATATKTNLEAAAEVGRQLRLRDLGGLIVIDFIDMRERKHMRQVEEEVKRSLENDKARVNVGRISKFGLLEMSRQRIKAALTEGSHLVCPHCNGTGQLKSPETQAVALLRRIHASAAKGQISRIDAQLPMDVAAYLLNNKREELVGMERRYQLQIHIHGNRDFLADQIEIELQKKEKEQAAKPEYVAASVQPQEVAEEAEKALPDSEPAEASAAEAEPGKKRRRRRRRKPRATEVETEESQATAEDKEVTAETPRPDGEESAEPTAAPPEEPTEEAPAKKPQRRRRTSSKAKKTTESTESTEASAETPGAEAVSSETAAAATPDDNDAAAAKPKRRRSRRKPKAAEAETQPDMDNATAEGETAAEASKSTEKPVTEPGADEKADANTTAKSKPKRPRRTSKKATAATEATQPEPAEAAAAETTAAPPAEESAAAKKSEAKKPVRRSRKKSPEKEKPEEAVAAEVKAEPLPVPAKADEEKPKRRQPSRSKTKTKKAEDAVEPTAATETPAAEDKPEEKAPARRTRKTPVKKTVAAEKPKATAKKAKLEEVTEEEVKPKRRRTVKKKPPEDAPPSEE